MTTSFRDPFPIIYVADVDHSVAFYRGAFGFELRYRWPEEGPLEYASLELPGGALGIVREGEMLHGLPVGSGARFELCMYADDTDAAAERLRSLGARELRPPEDMPWGERLCFFADPDGNPLHVTARLDSLP